MHLNHCKVDFVHPQYGQLTLDKSSHPTRRSTNSSPQKRGARLPPQKKRQQRVVSSGLPLADQNEEKKSGPVVLGPRRSPWRHSLAIEGRGLKLPPSVALVGTKTLSPSVRMNFGRKWSTMHLFQCFQNNSSTWDKGAPTVTQRGGQTHARAGVVPSAFHRDIEPNPHTPTLEPDSHTAPRKSASAARCRRMGSKTQSKTAKTAWDVHAQTRRKMRLTQPKQEASQTFKACRAPKMSIGEKRRKTARSEDASEKIHVDRKIPLSSWDGCSPKPKWLIDHQSGPTAASENFVNPNPPDS